jgi:uncharacterized protein DUF5655
MISSYGLPSSCKRLTCRRHLTETSPAVLSGRKHSRPGFQSTLRGRDSARQTDEAHIIRTLEYWDIERKRYPQYDHTAVIVAEDITSRFLNVIALFNGFIPLVALQVATLRIADHVSLVFTKVLDHVPLGPVDEDIEVQQPATRADWEERSTKDTLNLVDEVHGIIRAFEPSFELKFNKNFIGLARNGKPDNFVVFYPRKQWLRMGVALPQSDETTTALEQAGLKAEYDARWRRYVLNIDAGDAKRHQAPLKALLEQAYAEWK